MIIGAAKAGTTSLFNILSEHPQIYGSIIKETGFFSNDDKFKKGFNWYQGNFFKNGETYPVRMEATPAYLTWSDKVAPRLKGKYKSHTDIKFAVIFRDPSQRAYSHYWHRVRLGHETLSFEDAIRAEHNRLAQDWDDLLYSGDGKYGYFRAGCYSSRLKPFLKQFNENQFFFLLQEDLSPENHKNTLVKLLKFLDIDESIDLTYQRANVSSKPRKQWVRRSYWGLKKTPMKQIYKRMIPDKLRNRIYQHLFPSFEYPPIDKKIEKQLRFQYYEEIKKLEDIINRDLSHWVNIE